MQGKGGGVQLRSLPAATIALFFLGALHCGRSGTPPGSTSAGAGGDSAATTPATGATPGDGGDGGDALDMDGADGGDGGEVDAPPVRDHRPKLASKAQMTWVYAEARPGAQKLGYLRAGAIAVRDAKPTSEAGCSKGWYGVEPRGFVCVG